MHPYYLDSIRGIFIGMHITVLLLLVIYGPQLCWSVCLTPPSQPYTLKNSTSGSVGYFCPAHWVFDTTYLRKDAISCSGSTWLPSTPGNCIAATCLPSCQNGGTCMCGALSCWCSCTSGFAGSDCSLNMTTVPRSAGLALFYAMSDPHWIARPELGNKPWMMDISGKNLHGKLEGDPLLITGPLNREFSGIQFGAAVQFGYLVVNDTKNSNFAKILMNSTTAHTYFGYWNELGISTHHDCIFISYGIAATTNAYISLDDTKGALYVVRNSGFNKYQDMNYHFQDSTVYNSFGLTIEFPDKQIYCGSSDDNVQSSSLSSGTYTSGQSDVFYIGKDPGGSLSPNPDILFLVGNLGPVAVYGPENQAALVSGDITSFQTFSETIVLGGNAHLATSVTTCAIPPLGGLALPSSNAPNVPIGTKVYYVCPPFYVFNSGVDWRVTFVTCQSDGTWSPTLPSCVPNTLGFCDPPCMHGGTCSCASSCTCTCIAGRIGPDCSGSSTEISQLTSDGGYVGHWPMTIDYVMPDGTGGLWAIDISGNGNHLALGSGIGLDTGPYTGEEGTAFRINSRRAKSFIYAPASKFANFVYKANLTASSSDNKNFLSVKYNAPQAPGSGQPVFGWVTPAGATSASPALWLDESTGYFKFREPDGSLKALVSNGAPFNNASEWGDLKVVYQNGSPNLLAATHFSGSYSFTSIQPNNFPTASGFYIGYSSYPAEVTSDLSIGCFFYSTDSAGSGTNGKVAKPCMKAAKYKCSADAPDCANAVKSGLRAYVDDYVQYTCIQGYVVSGLSTQEQSLACSITSTSGLTATTAYSPTTPTACVSTTTCSPACSNGGTCSATSPYVCTCIGTFSGIDCSLDKCNLPQLSNALALWSLTNSQIDSSSKAIDIISSLGATLSTTSVTFGNGPYDTGPGVAQRIGTSASNLLLSSGAPIISTGSAFTISAYVKFSKTTFAQMDDFSPLLGWTTSPTLYLSPAGSATLAYVITGSTLSVPFSVTGRLGPGIWKFVSIIYNGASISLSVDGVTAGSAVTVSPAPPFTGAGLSIGATLMSVYPKTVFDGQIGCLSIYQAALNLTERVQLMTSCEAYLGGPPIVCPALPITTTTTPLSTTTTTTHLGTTTTTLTTTMTPVTTTTTPAATTTTTAGPTTSTTLTTTTTSVTTSSLPATTTTMISTLSTTVPTSAATNTSTTSMIISTTSKNNATISATLTTTTSLTCSQPPNIVNAAMISQSQMTWPINSSLLFACNFGYQFPDSSVEQNAICLSNATWYYRHSFCQYIPVTGNSLAILANISTSTLVALCDSIGDSVLVSSNIIAAETNASSINNALAAAEAIADTYERIATNAASMTATQVVSVTKAFASAVSNVMFALTNFSMESPISPTVDPTGGDAPDGDNTWKCTGAGQVVTTSAAPILNEAQTKKLYDQFLGMTKALTTLVSTALSSGEDFLINEKFFSCQIIKRKIKDIPGIYLNTSLSSCQFPAMSELKSKTLLLGNLQTNDMVSIVMYAYINNVYDVTQPFNTPTISLALYDSSRQLLKLNPEVKIYQSGKPLVRKSQIFAKQKVDAQCDISQIECDLEENADQLAASAIFPLNVKAGPFILIFPRIEFDYSAYIGLNFTPTARKWMWKVEVESTTGASVTNNCSFSLPYSFSKTDGVRAIVPDNAMVAALGNILIAPPLQLVVLVKKRFQGLSGTSLPLSACELQRVYGYHLKVGPCHNKTTSGSSRKKRTADGEELELLPESTEAEIKFTSNYMGDIGADLAIPPNTIAFSDVFANFTALVADNWGVLAFMVAVTVLFLIGIVVVWRYDRDDLNQWAFLPLIDNKNMQTYRYLVSINQLGAKPYDEYLSVWMRVFGEVDDSNWRLLKDGVRKNFSKIHPENFLMKAHYPIGDMHKLQLRISCQSSTPMAKPPSVHIEDILIIDVQTRKKFIFKLSKKFEANSKTQTFDLACDDDVNDWGFLVRKHVRTNFSESHLWISVMSRPLPSNWTRVERLACVVSGLFLAMVVNCMFYGKEATSPKAGILIGGVFRISWFTIWTSLVGCVIVIPPTFVIGFIFKKVRRLSAIKNENLTVFKILEQYRDGSSKGMAKPPFSLPWCCVIVGWVLVATSVGVSAFMIVMYSLTWGREKSLQWLGGMILHIVQDVILIQTIKVTIIAIVNSTLLQSPMDGVDIGAEVAVSKGNRTKKTMLFKRFRNLMAGMVANIFYVISFALVLGMTVNQSAFQQIKAIKPLVLVPGIEPQTGQVDYLKIFDWLSTSLIPNFLNGNQLQYSERSRARLFYLMKNHEVYLVGPIRIRQQRIQGTPCPITASVVSAYANRYSHLVKNVNQIRCQEEFAKSLGEARSSENRVFNGSWENTISQSIIDSLDHNTSIAVKNSPWAYRATEGLTYSGWQASYPTGGYYIDIQTRSIKQALADVQTLQTARWLDNATNSVIVELMVMNAQLNLFVPVKIVFEALPAGAMSYHVRLYPLQLYQYFGPNAMLALGIQGLWLMVNVIHIIKVTINLKKQQCKFFRDGWNLLESGAVFFSFTTMAIYVLRFPFIISTISQLKTSKKVYCNMDYLITWEDLMMSLFGFCFMFNLFIFFRFLSFNKSWAIFCGALSKGRGDIVSFLAIFVGLTTLYSGWGTLMLGFTDLHFSSFARAMLTLSYNVIGFNPQLLAGASNGKLAFLFYSSYALIVFFVAIQIFMAIVTQAYGEVSSNINKMTGWDADLSSYIEQGFKNLFPFGKSQNAPKTIKKAADKMQQGNVDDRWLATFNKLARFATLKLNDSEQDRIDDWLHCMNNYQNQTRITKLPMGFPGHRAITDARKDVGKQLVKLRSYDDSIS